MPGVGYDEPMDSACAPMPEVVFPGGECRPALGLGTWRMGERRAQRAAEVAALRAAFEIGWRVVDTAEMYGEGGAEEVIGEALAAALRAGLAREQVFIVSKAYPHHASRAGLLDACARSRRRLRLDVIDLYLLHWRGGVPMAQTLAGFAELQRRGWIRRWGVSNFDVADMEELLALAGADDPESGCAANQVCYSLGRRGVEFDLLPWQRARGLPLMAYCPVDQGRWPVRGRPRRCTPWPGGMAPRRRRWRWRRCWRSLACWRSPRQPASAICARTWALRRWHGHSMTPTVRHSTGPSRRRGTSTRWRSSEDPRRAPARLAPRSPAPHPGCAWRWPAQRRSAGRWPPQEGARPTRRARRAAARYSSSFTWYWPTSCCCTLGGTGS